MDDIKCKYVWELAKFLDSHNKKMSLKELAAHLNRNLLRTELGEEFRVDSRGMRNMLNEIQEWVRKEHDETKIASVYVD